MVASDGVDGTGGGIEVGSGQESLMAEGQLRIAYGLYTDRFVRPTRRRRAYIVISVGACIFDRLFHLVNNIALTLFGIHNGNPLRLISEGRCVPCLDFFS